MDILCFLLAIAVSVAVWTVLGVLADLEAEKAGHRRTRELHRETLADLADLADLKDRLRGLLDD